MHNKSEYISSHRINIFYFSDVLFFNVDVTHRCVPRKAEGMIKRGREREREGGRAFVPGWSRNESRTIHPARLLAPKFYRRSHPERETRDPHFSPAHDVRAPSDCDCAHAEARFPSEDTHTEPDIRKTFEHVNDRHSLSGRPDALDFRQST